MASVQKRALTAGVWAGAFRLASFPISLAITFALARLLAPHAFGAFQFLVSLCLFAAVVGKLGLDQAILRLAAEHLASGASDRLRADVLYATCIGALSACLTGLAIWAAVRIGAFGLSGGTSAAPWVGVWAALLVFQGVLVELLRGLQHLRAATLLGNTPGGGLLAASLFLLSLGAMALLPARSLHAVLAALAFSAVVATLVLIRLAARAVRGLAPKGRATSRSSFFHLAFPFWVTNAVLFVLVQADLWIVGSMGTSDSLALYAAAFRLAPVGLIVTSVLYWTLPPFLIERFTMKDKSGMEDLLRGAATLSTVLALPLIVPMILAPGWVLRVVYGSYYTTASPMLMLLTFGVILQVTTGMRGYLLMFTGRQWQQMGITVVAAFLNVGGGLLTIRTFGPVGVAAVAAGAMAVQVFAELVYVRLSLGVWTHFSLKHFLQILRLRRLTLQVRQDR